MKKGIRIPLQIFSWKPGCSRAGEAVHIVWKIPPNPEYRDKNKVFRLQSQCLTDITTYQILCAYSARSSRAERFVDHHLNLEWKSVKTVCLECRAKGALPLVRTKRRNRASNEHRAQRARFVASVAPQASHEVVLAPRVVGGAVPSDAPGVGILTIACPRGRNRKQSDEPPTTRSRKARSRRE